MHQTITKQTVRLPGIVSAPRSQPTWDRFYLVRALPIWLYWPLLGVLLFFIGDILILAFGESRLLVPQIAVAALAAHAALSNHYFFVGFQNAIRRAQPLFWKEKEECEDWLAIRLRATFTLDSWQSRATTGTVTLLGLASVWSIGLPFQSMWLNALGITGFLFVLMMCAQSMFVCYRLATALVELSGKEISPPFMLLPNPGVAALGGLYLGVALAVGVAYILTAVTVIMSPYGLGFVLACWLTLLAFYPISLVIFWATTVHRINRRIKFGFLQRANAQVARSFETVESAEAVEKNDLEVLEKLMGVQDAATRLQSWPLDLKSVITFVLASLMAALQVYLLISRVGG